MEESGQPILAVILNCTSKPLVAYFDKGTSKLYFYQSSLKRILKASKLAILD